MSTHPANAENYLAAWPADSSRLQTFILQLSVGSKRNHKTELWLRFFLSTTCCSTPSLFFAPYPPLSLFLLPTSYPSLFSTLALIAFSKSSATSAPETSYSSLSCRPIPVHSFRDCSSSSTWVPHPLSATGSQSQILLLSSSFVLKRHPSSLSCSHVQLFYTTIYFPNLSFQFLSKPTSPFPFC